MYLQLLPVPLILVGTWITWRARNREDYRTVAIFQPLTTVLTLAVAALGLLAPSANAGFTTWMLLGLGLSLVGVETGCDPAIVQAGSGGSGGCVQMIGEVFEP